jgi:small subunit ribosomal protein S3
MIERTFVAQRTREYYIRKFVEKSLGNVGISTITLKKIPLGEKIVISTSRPSLIVGSKGANIRSLTKTLKEKFNLENPQIEINEVSNPFLNANIVAERIVSSLERFGSARFKGIGHKMMENVMNAGALGIEITISGKIPGARAKSWRFYTGYLKKCGDVALSVRVAKKSALLKSGIIGVKVAIMPPDIVLPDKIKLLEEPEQVVAPVEKESAEKPKAPKRKRAAPKKSKSKEEAKAESSEQPAAAEETKAAEATETSTEVSNS